MLEQPEKNQGFKNYLIFSRLWKNFPIYTFENIENFINATNK